MTQICEKFNEKIYPTGPVKNWIFSNLRGGEEGGVADIVRKFQFFLTLPLMTNILCKNVHFCLILFLNFDVIELS